MIPCRETDILIACLDYLAVKRIFAYRTNSGTMKVEDGAGTRYVQFNTAEGCADITGLLPDGRALYVETKRRGKKPTREQQSFLDAVTKNNGLAIVAHSVDELDAALRAAGYLRRSA